jgi:hypothetical protein
MADETLIARVRAGDTWAAIEEIAAGGDALAGAKALYEAGKAFYWKEKDLPRCVALLRAGAQLGLTADEPDASRRYDLRSAAKGMCYDLASFTWPGWDEPGIAITAADLAVGLDAARANLRLAVELNKGDLPLSRAHWMLGAQELAAGLYGEAIASFERGEDAATRAGLRDNALLCSGFAAVARLLEQPEDGAASERLEAAKTELATLEQGSFFVTQIETAAQVFARSGG